MVKPRASDSILQRHFQVEHADDGKQHLGDDLRSSRGTNGENRPTVLVEDDRRAHARKGPFAWLDFVGLGAYQSKRIGHAGLTREVVHFVIQNNAGTRHNHLRAKTSIHRGGDCYPISIAVRGSDVSGMPTKDRIAVPCWIVVGQQLLIPLGD